MSYYLILDDVRSYKDIKNYAPLPDIPEENWKIARTYEEFIEIINNFGVPTFVALDHDLGPMSYANIFDGSEKTGRHCAEYLINYCSNKRQSLPKYTVHSLNPVGAQNIKWLLESYRDEVNR